ncbi:branched-chain amino acid ABC transporter permease [Effusibacillus dendaii]|uniref:Branched-chain amino acid ABC transporter permease n=1 Tax=Effusibacillus dendaii TaxID=2743772 RepID=A0A7I8DCD8_9BACL|nr:branched-chain amino acid ABC transporter permease [Effusibacillus dendaii]BCJ85581.1 branched-chain amino acid ABC transporter permease [Effusibacillus dendaii]
MAQLMQVIISGILVGGIYALISMGLNLILGVVRIINSAHGEFLMISMYISFLFFATWGLDPYLSALIVVLLLFIFGCLVQRIMIQPILETSAAVKIFATLGLSIMMQNFALMIWNADYRTVHTAYQTSVIRLGEVAISVPRLIAFAVAILIAVCLFLFLKKTFIGKAIRAVAMERRAASLMGIHVRRIYLVAFGIGSALVGLAGSLLMPIYYVFPTVGTLFVLTTFVVVVLGGMGSMFGAFLGGILIGLVEALAGVFISPGLKEAVYFVIFILVLLFRPSGLFSLGKGSEEVGLK